MFPLVSVIVVNHNRADLLAECLESLLAQTWKRLEIIVVDNASQDSSCQLVNSYQARGVSLLAQDRNLGFAAAVNRGWKASGGEWVALLNNDAVAAPDWIEHLVTGLLENPSLGMAASKIVLVDGRIDKAGHLIYLDGQNRGRGSGEVDLGQYDGIEAALLPDGCAALYRRELLEQVGGFDEDFFAYAEDADLGLRARRAGWKCLYVPSALVSHRHSSTTGGYSAQKIYWVERNRMWLAVKNFPLPLLLLNPLFTANRWFWSGLAGLLGKGAPGSFRAGTSSWTAVRTILRAHWDGLKGIPGMWRKRGPIRRLSRMGSLEFYQLLRRHRISARTLAFRDHSRG